MNGVGCDDRRAQRGAQAMVARAIVHLGGEVDAVEAGVKRGGESHLEALAIGRARASIRSERSWYLERHRELDTLAHRAVVDHARRDRGGIRDRRAVADRIEVVLVAAVAVVLEI